jgi:hypothetical protein
MSERSESNGGGGNRTRVLWYLDVGLYVRSSSINVARDRLSEQSPARASHNKVSRRP